MVTKKNAGHFIGGEIIFEGESHDLYNPATNHLSHQNLYAEDQHLDSAIQSAINGQKIWSAYSWRERSKVLLKACELIKLHETELATLDVLESGKPISEAKGFDIDSGIEAIEYFAHSIMEHGGNYSQFGKSFSYSKNVPYGVVLGIGAWNYPFQIACWKMAPALSAGNAMIFKPSEFTPSSAVLLADLLSKAGLPAGVFNVLQGARDVGSKLVHRPEIKKVSLTGSVSTGISVYKESAKTLKQTTLELGGKSPLIIFKDADLDNAISAAMLANFYTQGEICSNGTRVFVHEDILPVFKQRLIECAKAIAIGNPMDPTTQMGPLIHAQHLKKVQSYIEIAKKEGATLEFGGSYPKHLLNTEFSQGNYIKPTIFSECADSMTHVQEEIFGPVLSLLSFKDTDEVVERANNTPYGLAAGLFTQDINRGHLIADQLQAGLTWINTYNLTPSGCPFGGVKNSGFGRENAKMTLDSYSQVKTTYVETGKTQW